MNASPKKAKANRAKTSKSTPTAAAQLGQSQQADTPPVAPSQAAEVGKQAEGLPNVTDRAADELLREVLSDRTETVPGEARTNGESDSAQASVDDELKAAIEAGLSLPQTPVKDDNSSAGDLELQREPVERWTECVWIGEPASWQRLSVSIVSSAFWAHS